LKFGAGSVDVTLDLSRPPSANVVDGSEGFLWSLVNRKGGGEVLVFHDSLLLSFLSLVAARSTTPASTCSFPKPPGSWRPVACW
jgi:hypothetical protein